jgi:hypothetical protein
MKFAWSEIKESKFAYDLSTFSDLLELINNCEGNCSLGDCI